MNKSRTEDLKSFFKENFNTFESSLNGDRASLLHSIRKSALERFNTLEFPTTSSEEWKYTNINPLLSTEFEATLPEDSEITAEQLGSFLFDDADYHTLVFVNGAFKPGLSRISTGNGQITITTLKTALKLHPDLVYRHLATLAKTENSIFNSLNTAFLNDGVFVYLKNNVILEKPLHVLYIQAGKRATVKHPRNLFILGSNAQMKIIENYETVDSEVYFTNAVTEVIMGENAQLEHIKIQNESLGSFHISTIETQLERDSRYTSYNINFGSRIARNDLNARFISENGECNLHGLYLANEGQLIDNHTLMDHAKAHCQSNELYKGVLNGNGRAVFNGKVKVHPDAQKTNAYQQNKNILLSPDARVDTKPQLEIFADDVKCSHGATIGQLDSEAMFYLRSRGFSPELARATLVFAFASDVVHSISVNQVREYLENRIAEKLSE